MGMLEGNLCKVSEGVKKDVNVVDVTHCTLIVMHAFEITFRIISQNRLDHLGHITEFFEGDAQTVNGGRPRPVQLT